MNAPTLFDAMPHARHDDPQTSHDAADAVDLSNRCAQVLAALTNTERGHGATCTELQATLTRSGVHMDTGWIARRLVDLERSGHVKRTTYKRPGASSRQQTVWVLS